MARFAQRFFVRRWSTEAELAEGRGHAVQFDTVGAFADVGGRVQQLTVREKPGAVLLVVRRVAERVIHGRETLHKVVERDVDLRAIDKKQFDHGSD